MEVFNRFANVQFLGMYIPSLWAILIINMQLAIVKINSSQIENIILLLIFALLASPFISMCGKGVELVFSAFLNSHLYHGDKSRWQVLYESVKPGTKLYHEFPEVMALGNKNQLESWGVAKVRGRLNLDSKELKNNITIQFKNDIPEEYGSRKAFQVMMRNAFTAQLLAIAVLAISDIFFLDIAISSYIYMGIILVLLGVGYYYEFFKFIRFIVRDGLTQLDLSQD